MIVIKVEMWPGGDQKNAYPLGTAVIINTATGTATQGNYVAQVFSKNGRLIRKETVSDFPRKRLLVWDLLHRVLAGAFGSRN